MSINNYRCLRSDRRLLRGAVEGLQLRRPHLARHRRPSRQRRPRTHSPRHQRHLHKQDSPEDLQTSIHQVAQGRVLIDQKYLQSLVTASQPPEEASPRFTERERSILRFLLQGLANKEIAVQLRISESAVKSSLQLLFNKLGL